MLPVRLLLPLLIVFPLFARHPALLASKDGARFVVDTNVTCRSKPDLSPETSFGISIGTPVNIARQIESDGVTWYFTANGCWVYGPGTGVFHKAAPDMLLLAMFDHILARKNVPLNDYVAVENYLLEDPEWQAAAGRARVAGLLRFRYLQMLDRALATNEGDTWHDNALVRFWLLTHRDVIDYDELGAEWYVTSRAYWQIFDANRNAPWAEELAWVASNLPVHSDECNFACQLNWVLERQGQYWSRLPAGARVREELGRAKSQILPVANDACASNEPSSYTVVPRALVGVIRRSLSKVSDPGKQEILQALARIDQKCRIQLAPSR